MRRFFRITRRELFYSIVSDSSVSQECRLRRPRTCAGAWRFLSERPGGSVMTEVDSSAARSAIETLSGDGPPMHVRGSDPIDLGSLRQWLQKYDRDAALVATFLPAHLRDAFVILRVFNAEVSRVVEGARGNVDAAMLRFQFWRSVVRAAVEGREMPHPLVRPLAILFRRHNWNPRLLERQIEAREIDSAPEAHFQTLEDLYHYAEQTSTSQLYLLLEAAGDDSETADVAASLTGKSIAIATFLRGFHIHCNTSKVYIPEEVLEAHGLTGTQVIRTRGVRAEQSSAGSPAAERARDVEERIIAAAFDLASVGNASLREARGMHESLTPAAHAALLPAVPAGRFYRHLEAIQFDVFHPHLSPKGHREYFGLLFELWKHSWRGSF